MDCTINIFDTDLIWKGLIDNPVSLVHKSSWHEIINSTLVVSKDAANIEELQVGRILVVNNQLDKVLVIETITRNLDESTFTYDCIPLKGILNWRIAHPSDYGGTTGATQAQFMIAMVNSNLVSQTRDDDRKFWNSAGATGGVNMLQTGAYNGYGNTMDYAVDWNTGYLGDAIVSLAKAYDASAGQHPIGWNIHILPDWSKFQFDTYQATDRSINQTALPPVVFSEEFGNIKNATWTNSNKDWRNVAYVNWTDANNAAQDTPVGNTSKGATIAFNRKEIIISSSKKTSNDVITEGRSALNSRPIVESFTADIVNNDRTMSTYGTDWNLGDIVTIQSSELNVSVDAQITEIDETYANGAYSIGATFNEGQLNLVKLIKQEIRG
jgi:Siphovirus ReqiPepy6 Gp37-like protein